MLQIPDCLSRFDSYIETAGVVSGAETPIFTYTNVGAYYVEKLVCSGTSDAVFKLKINGTTKRTLRNSWNDRNVTFDYSSIAKKFVAGAIVTVTAEHSEKNNQGFEANVEGFTYVTT